MALARGPAVDYDEWATLTGDDEWKWENILPLMKDVCLLPTWLALVFSTDLII
jgi:choline dehydrogenase-like flavoprotein